jgi:hypothetical protein
LQNKLAAFNIRKIIKSLASIKLAVVVILAIATITAWGTILESQYDAMTAQKLVYKSVWMYAVLIIFAANLIAVMIDRWPWKAKHTGFVLAHIGLLTMLLGAWMTSRFGVDGSMSLGIGDSSSTVLVSQTDFAVYTTFDGTNYQKLFDREVDFFLDSPSEKKPLVIPTPSGDIKVVDYYPYAFREEKVIESKDQNAGLGVRFQMQNPNVNMTEWLMQPSVYRDVIKDFGPAQVILVGSKDFKVDESRNSILLKTQPGSDELEYEIHSRRDPKKVKRGHAHSGETIETGWMSLVLRVLKVIPRARQELSFRKSEKPTPLTTSAVLIDYNGNRQWMGLNSLLKLFSDQSGYVVSYGNRSLKLGFPIRLKDFHVGHYQGTTRASSYASVVDVPELGDHTISMNEPLTYKGYTFYQASFDSDEQGKPVASILSVNRDPGRWIKYLGAFLIVFGAIHLFWSKRRQATSRAGIGKS